MPSGGGAVHGGGEALDKIIISAKARRPRAAFDVRAFHDEVLKDGAMPLSILESKIERWIASRKRAS